jgi:hypothetical protein
MDALGLRETCTAQRNAAGRTFWAFAIVHRDSYVGINRDDMGGCVFGTADDS